MLLSFTNLWLLLVANGFFNMIFSAVILLWYFSIIEHFRPFLQCGLLASRLLRPVYSFVLVMVKMLHLDTKIRWMLYCHLTLKLTDDPRTVPTISELDLILSRNW